MELEETIRSTLGEGKATEAMIKSYAKQDWYLPKTVADANIQLSTCRRFLEKLTCEGSIAVQGYKRGERLLEKHTQIFEKAILTDRLYLVKFLHLLDTIFQSFLKEFLGYMYERQPVRKARSRLRDFMVDWVDRIMKDLEISQRPRLELPPALEEVSEAKPAAVTRKRRAEDDVVGTTSKPKAAKTSDDQIKNPDITPEYWERPRSKKFSDAWNKDTLSMLPKAKHHLTGKEVPLCVRYQADGRCRTRCRFAHIPSGSLTGGQQEQAKTACAKAYE
jgi:hypothetical protein